MIGQRNHRLEIVQTLLLRNGVESLLLTKHTYPNGKDYFYALSHAVAGEPGQFLSIPVSHKRIREVRQGQVTLRAAFATVPETAFWYRCTQNGNDLECGESEQGSFPAEHLPDDVTLDVAAGRAPARVPANEEAVLRILTNTVAYAKQKADERAAPAPESKRIETPVGVVTPRPRKIDIDVLAVLSRATCEGNLLRLNGQLDRKMYEAANKILDAAGGRWKGARSRRTSSMAMRPRSSIPSCSPVRSPGRKTSASSRPPSMSWNST